MTTYNVVLRGGHSGTNVISTLPDMPLSDAVNEAVRQFGLSQDDDTQIVLYQNGKYDVFATEYMRTVYAIKMGWK